MIKIPRDRFHSSEFDDLVNRIVVASNWQNEIDALDIHANDSIQIRLEQSLRGLGYAYLRKKKGRKEFAATAVAGETRVKMEEFAYAVAVCEYSSELPVDPSVGKAGLFSKAWYSRVFPSEDPHYYLGRYWVSKLARTVSRGSEKYGDAKWLATAFLWGHLKEIARAPARRRRLYRACRDGGWIESGAKQTNELRLAMISIFEATYRYYRANSLKETGERIPTAAFYKKRGNDVAFQRFWDSDANRDRARAFEARLDRFRRHVAAVPDS